MNSLWLSSSITVTFISPAVSEPCNGQYWWHLSCIKYCCLLITHPNLICWDDHFIRLIIFCWSGGDAMYTAKNEQLVPSWWKQCWTMFCCPHCSRLLTTLNNIVEPESGVTILFNNVNSLEQCGQQNIVQYCFHQLGTSCSFWLIFCCVQSSLVGQLFDSNSFREYNQFIHWSGGSQIKRTTIKWEGKAIT